MNIDEPVWECFAPRREGYSVPSGTDNFLPWPKSVLLRAENSTLPYGKRLKFYCCHLLTSLHLPLAALGSLPKRACLKPRLQDFLRAVSFAES